MMRIIDKNWEDIVSPWKNEFGYKRVNFIWEKEYKSKWDYKLIIE